MRSDSFITESGILPVNLFSESQTFFKDDIGVKKSLAISPENSFWLNKSDFNAPSLLNPGIGPENELLAKVIVLSLGSSRGASISIVIERPKSERWRPVMTNLSSQGLEI